MLSKRQSLHDIAVSLRHLQALMTESLQLQKDALAFAKTQHSGIDSAAAKSHAMADKFLEPLMKVLSERGIMSPQIESIAVLPSKEN